MNSSILQFVYLSLTFSLLSLSFKIVASSDDVEDENLEELSEDIHENGNRNSRLFRFPFYSFQRVGFGNVLGGSRCIVDEGDQLKERHGLCLLGSKCRQMNGVSMNDGCGSNFGLNCCIFNATCNKQRERITVKRDKTYIFHKRNEEECLTEYRFPRQNNVCQLRLEFKQFNIVPPNNGGDCVMDKLTIKKTGNLQQSMTLCGKANEVDHLYLHYGESNEIVINLDVSKALNTGDVDILVEQIKCNTNDIAPEGCTQYFQQQRGDVRSFNFDPNLGQQLNNHIYTVCIKGNEGSSGVTWSRCTGHENEFDIASVSDPPTSWSIGCNGDSVTIPGSPLARYCLNSTFPTTVETTAKPYMMYVNLNQFEKLRIPPGPIVGICPPDHVPDPLDDTACIPGPHAPQLDINNRGFCLRYNRM